MQVFFRTRPVRVFGPAEKPHGDFISRKLEKKTGAW
jgi:hypothetical protein